MKSENPTREVTLDKVVINIGVGEGGEKLEKAMKVIEILTGRKPVKTIAKKTIRDFNIRKRQPIGTKVTLRKGDAENFLKRALWVKNFKLPQYSFDETGSLSFGIRDYTSFEGIKYDPEIGIFGMDINVNFKRRCGERVSRRTVNRKKLPKRQRVSREEAMEYMKKKFGIEILEVK
ncbi:MAG: 50S ribosomal protein L5 [Thermoplasmata archaeon]|jgi:large subunit ribosomal protein L5|nr:50S ribosomal protein L5 [Thermoplasmata archaeon]